jgi:hypothetical protein
VSDLCSSPFCADIALPGQELCAGCLADLQAERAQRDDETARLTTEHEARIAAEEVAA